MKRIATDCHRCFLAGHAMPAAFATADGDFFCNLCRQAEGLEVESLMTVQQYLDAHGLNQPAQEAQELTRKQKRVKPAECAEPEIVEESKEEKIEMEKEVNAVASWCSKCHKIKIKKTSTTGKCVPCQCGFSATNPKRLALEARDAGQPVREAAKTKTAKRLTAPKTSAVASTPVASPQKATTSAMHEASESGVMTLTVTDKQAVLFFGALKTEDKARALQGLFDQMEA